MRKRLLAILIFAALAFSAQGAEIQLPKKSSMAILFSFYDLISAVLPYDDGFQSGAGLKLWISDRLAGRALAIAKIEPESLSGSTSLGLSMGAEYHLRRGKASPFLCGSIGGKALFAADGDVYSIYGGIGGGVEVMLAPNFSISGEYQALLVAESGSLYFYLGDKAILGFSIYF